jgi:hypothetical protein
MLFIHIDQFQFHVQAAIETFAILCRTTTRALMGWTMAGATMAGWLGGWLKAGGWTLGRQQLPAARNSVVFVVVAWCHRGG